MSGQMSLVEITQAAPRCRMCTRPARWLHTRRQWAMYCAGSSCNNRERLCRGCQTSFIVNIDGASSVYCPTCRTGSPAPVRLGPSCAWCGAPNPASRNPCRAIWPYVCIGCLGPIKHVVDRLKTHRVPHERARRLLNDPGCEICGFDILAKVKEPTHGKYQSLLVVDHDHRCCPGDTKSCGKCIRGLICRPCNLAIGMLGNDSARSRALADYLDRTAA